LTLYGGADTIPSAGQLLASVKTEWKEEATMSDKPNARHYPNTLGWVKMSHDKAETAFQNVIKWAKQYMDIEMVPCRWQTKLHERSLSGMNSVPDSEDGPGFRFSCLLETAVVGSATFIRFKVCSNDTVDTYTGIDIDLSSKLWTSFAWANYMALHYHCNRQRENSKNDKLQLA
jgi:hypothetical protein